jgi:formate dehydrogenase beta subunit
MAGQTLELRAVSATSSAAPGVRDTPVVSKLIDTSTCIGCKACEVACQEWNDLPPETTVQVGTYQTLPQTTSNFWNLIKFHEYEDGAGLHWLMRKDQCMHCGDPGCLKACPAPGAIVQYNNGIVDFQQEHCIGCGYCITGCPFDIPRFNTRTKKVYKCTLCVDRVAVGLEPACIKACPTSCLQFGTKDQMRQIGEKRVAQLKAAGYSRDHGAGAGRSPRGLRSAQGSEHSSERFALEDPAKVDRQPGHHWRDHWHVHPLSALWAEADPRKRSVQAVGG